MERKKFLKKLALSATSLPLLAGGWNLGKKIKWLDAETIESPCGDHVTPVVGEGPFYINEKLLRSNIAENKPGVPLTLIFRVEDADCKPIPGAIVDIWHCDKDGKYSDEGSLGTTGEKWLRGYQATDINGTCTFQTIFPGWYHGRLTHIHGKLRVGSVTKQTTNFFMPKKIEQEVFSNPLYSRGQNPITVAEDIELRGDTKSYEELMMSVSGDLNQGYVARFTLVFV